MGRKSIVFILILACAASVSANTFRVSFLDVGEGESILIEADGHYALIDTGNVATGYRVVQHLKQRNITTLDYLIITHTHYDHMSGIFQILPYITIQSRYDNGQSLEGMDGDVYRWYQEFFRTKSYKALKKGDVLQLGDAELRVLSPETMTGDWNTDSVVIKAVWKSTAFLLVGDATTRTEEALLKAQAPVQANVLKIGHHGAKDATSQAFLQAVSPQHAVISINAHNVRGYPDPQVVQRLKDNQIRLSTTYEEGTLIFESDGQKIIRLKQNNSKEAF